MIKGWGKEKTIAHHLIFHAVEAHFGIFHNYALHPALHWAAWFCISFVKEMGTPEASWFCRRYHQNHGYGLPGGIYVYKRG